MAKTDLDRTLAELQHIAVELEQAYAGNVALEGELTATKTSRPWRLLGIVGKLRERLFRGNGPN